jgi:hypothetical protein
MHRLRCRRARAEPVSLPGERAKGDGQQLFEGEAVTARVQNKSLARISAVMLALSWWLGWASARSASRSIHVSDDRRCGSGSRWLHRRPIPYIRGVTSERKRSNLNGAPLGNRPLPPNSRSENFRHSFARLRVGRDYRCCSARRTPKPQ